MEEEITRNKTLKKDGITIEKFPFRKVENNLIICQTSIFNEINAASRNRYKIGVA